MMKLCPSWKVYQGWLGCDPFDNIALPLCEVTVNNVYDVTPHLNCRGFPYLSCRSFNL
jgi:hypothetical protein